MGRFFPSDWIRRDSAGVSPFASKISSIKCSFNRRHRQNVPELMGCFTFSVSFLLNAKEKVLIEPKGWLFFCFSEGKKFSSKILILVEISEFKGEISIEAAINRALFQDRCLIFYQFGQTRSSGEVAGGLLQCYLTIAI